jgi:hypothetical protein
MTKQCYSIWVLKLRSAARQPETNEHQFRTQFSLLSATIWILHSLNHRDKLSSTQKAAFLCCALLSGCGFSRLGHLTDRLSDSIWASTKGMAGSCLRRASNLFSVSFASNCDGGRGIPQTPLFPSLSNARHKLSSVEFALLE